VMVVNDENGAHLVRNKLQYDYDWISQPQVMIEGKMVFRDEKGYPKAVFNTNTEKWMTPEEADVVITKEKWIEMLSQYTWVGDDGIKRNGSNFLKDYPGFSKILTTRSEIEEQSIGAHFQVFNPSGEITFWMSQEEAINRFSEGAVIEILYEGMATEPEILAKAAFQQWSVGNKNIFLTFGDVGVSRAKIQGPFIGGVGVKISDIPQIDDGQGHIVSPVVRLPKHARGYNGKSIIVKVFDPVFWLSDYIEAGATSITIDNLP